MRVSVRQRVCNQACSRISFSFVAGESKIFVLGYGNGWFKAFGPSFELCHSSG